jgi:hypothetical protein
MCKGFGGLGIPNLRDLNLCLLGPWIKRYQLDEGKIWKQTIDDKYKTSKPNIFYSNTDGSSQFFKSLMWAAKAAKMGYRWKIGNGEKVKFWEDNWLGSSSLAIQLWNLYAIVNEKNKTVHDLWDGNTLKCTFRRRVGPSMFRDWEDILQLASTITLNDEQDELIWTFSSNGIYSSQSLYKIINFRGGVQPVHTPAVWKLKIPPRIHFFLWLFTKNKILTRDNVGKRKQTEDNICLFYNEPETIQHLFFDCVVAKQMWVKLSECIEIECGDYFESIAKYWLSHKKCIVINLFTFAALWGLWKLRNCLCFQNGCWIDVNNLL